MANTTTFAMDTATVDDVGKAVSRQAYIDMNNAPGYAFALADAVNVDTDSMPTMFTEALTTFQDNLRSTITKLFFQRYDIGQALLGAANNAEITDLQNASSFTWSQSGGVPVPGALPGQVSSTV